MLRFLSSFSFYGKTLGLTNQPQPTNLFRSVEIEYVGRYLGKISFCLLSIGMLLNLLETCRLIEPFVQSTLEFPIKKPNLKREKIFIKESVFKVERTIHEKSKKPLNTFF